MTTARGLNCPLLGIVAALAACTTLGCQDDSTRLPVSGTVTIDGRPLTSGSIRFVPRHGRPVQGSIGSDGRFELIEQTASGPPSPGVLPGTYRVSISASEVVDENTGEVADLAPTRYADFRTSGIEVKIDRPRSDVAIELTAAEDESSSAADKTDAEENDAPDDAKESSAPQEQDA